MRELLKYLVEGLSFMRMTLADINSRILSYPYAYFEEKPAPLTTFDTHGSQSGIYTVCIYHDKRLHTMSNITLQLLKCESYSTFCPSLLESSFLLVIHIMSVSCF